MLKDLRNPMWSLYVGVSVKPSPQYLPNDNHKVTNETNQKPPTCWVKIAIQTFSLDPNSNGNPSGSTSKH